MRLFSKADVAIDNSPTDRGTPGGIAASFT